MSTALSKDAFALQPHRLAGGLLRPLAAGEAESLGAACADIDPYRRLGLTAAALAGYLHRPDPALFRYVIEAEDRVVGVMALRSPWLRGPFLEMLAVMPAAQGMGFGRRAVDWASGQSCLVAANLWTTVSDFNGSARGFYARLGFVVVTELPGLVAEGTAEILLRRRLAGS